MANRLRYLKDNMPNGMLQTSPNAAFYALIDIGERGGDAAFSFMLGKNVSTCPGTKFGSNSRDSVRVSLAGPHESFERDISMLNSALQEWVSSNS